MIKTRNSQKKTALIVGSKGQDGVLLTQILNNKNYNVIGLSRDGVATPNGFFAPVNLESYEEIKALMLEHNPDEVYYLAAVHRSSEDIEQDTHQYFMKSFSIHVVGLLNFLDCIKSFSPLSRIFYAASSHVFGEPSEFPQVETTPFRPKCHYGITKATGVEICRFYREKQGIFCSVGILYNHESSLRSPHFISRKIINAAVQIKLKLQSELILGNLEAKVDWSHAKDVVRAMNAILNIDHPDDFIVSSGRLYTVKEFSNAVFSLLELDGEQYVKEEKSMLQKPAYKVPFCGDPKKMYNLTHWRPEYSFITMIKEMLFNELNEKTHGSK